MVRLEQIQLLEKKINKAVEIINVLKQENSALKSTIQKSQERMAELENLLEQFKGEQNRIEEGILNALNKLDQLEDQVAEGSPEAPGSFESSLPSRDSEVPEKDSSAEETSPENVTNESAQSDELADSGGAEETVEEPVKNSHSEEEAVESDQEDTSPSIDMFGNEDPSPAEGESSPEPGKDAELDIF